MNDSYPVNPGGLPVGAAHTSEQEAVSITQQDDVPELVEFILALKMEKPVSTDKAARLFQHLTKQQTASNSTLIADQMRTDGWEADLSHGENLALIAERTTAYLATDDGVSLFNFFVMTFARTSGTMFD
jgi:hypothetical protein